jgi:thiamine pyrophosphokinase
MSKEENKILVITGGQIGDDFLLELLKKESYQLIIAADHGLMAADRLNIGPDYIVGDFDSVSASLLEKYENKSTPIKTFPREKDKTDTQIALELALMKHPTAIDLVGATGSRFDHVLANIHLLLLPLQLGITASILDANNKIYLKDKSFTIDKNNQYGQFVSLLPFSERVSGLTLKGFKYPLDHIIYPAGSSLGISNEIELEKANVEFTEGILIVIEARD